MPRLIQYTLLLPVFFYRLYILKQLNFHSRQLFSFYSVRLLLVELWLWYASQSLCFPFSWQSVPVSFSISSPLNFSDMHSSLNRRWIRSKRIIQNNLWSGWLRCSRWNGNYCKWRNEMSFLHTFHIDSHPKLVYKFFQFYTAGSALPVTIIVFFVRRKVRNKGEEEVEWLTI